VAFHAERTVVTDADRPVLRVIRGDATPEEIAAVVAVLLSRSAPDPGAAFDPGARPSAWAGRSRLLRRPLFPGPDAWRRSALPG
jgi:acyl-CoA carboxylase epsilon subunit